MKKEILNDEGVPSKNQKQLESFAEYCISHPNERFYQALRNWSGEEAIYFAKHTLSVLPNENTYQITDLRDTFYLDK